MTTEEVGLEEMWNLCSMDFENDKDAYKLQKGQHEGPPDITPWENFIARQNKNKRLSYHSPLEWYNAKLDFEKDRQVLALLFYFKDVVLWQAMDYIVKKLYKKVSKQDIEWQAT